VSRPAAERSERRLLGLALICLLLGAGLTLATTQPVLLTLGLLLLGGFVVLGAMGLAGPGRFETDRSGE
jgi:hypothetical protein